jgi:predicted transcriptional regulator
LITDPAIENRLVDVKPLTVRVPARLHEELKRRAEAENETEATVIRRALRRELGVETR